ncbi:MAG: NEW3 domain-containing protein [candidate division Zixibacteria bacterium]|nr:NEW3 domain-containing protein [candidate division Zixibacteria bacterium]
MNSRCFSYMKSFSSLSITGRLLLLQAVSAFVVIMSTHAAYSQIIYNPNDERFRQLAFEKAVWTFKDFRQQYERDIRLREQNLISTEKLFSTERQYRIAEIELEQALLALTQETPYLAVERAILRQDTQGRAIIEIELRNLSQMPPSTNLDSLMGDIDSRLSLDDLLILRNVFVSLKEDNTIIALPYVRRIDSLVPGESTVLTYQLLKDIDRVEVNIQYSGKVETKQIQLQRGTGTSGLRMSAIPMAQESEYGSIAAYDIHLDRGEGFMPSIELKVEGLPGLFLASFTDVSSGARVTKVAFPPASTTQELRLEVQLPSRMQMGGLIDSTLRFVVQALSPTDGRLAGEIKLELVPVGRGEITLKARNWRFSLHRSESIVLPLEIANIGSVSVRDIRWEINPPAGWKADPQPQSIAVLEPGETENAQIIIQAANDEIYGEYEIDVRVFCIHNGSRIETDLKTFRVELNAAGGVTNIVLLVSLIGGLIAAVVWLAKRLGKR